MATLADIAGKIEAAFNAGATRVDLTHEELALLMAAIPQYRLEAYNRLVVGN